MAWNKSEQKFWHLIQKEMAGQWNVTRHEDKGVSPGVPDLHYSVGADCQIGWLELKSKDLEISKSCRIQVEPSQHQYIRKWHPLMPIHFLIRAKGIVYLVDGKYAAAIAALESPNTICAISIAHFPQDRIKTDLLPLLRTITRTQDGHL